MEKEWNCVRVLIIKLIEVRLDITHIGWGSFVSHKRLSDLIEPQDSIARDSKFTSAQFGTCAEVFSF